MAYYSCTNQRYQIAPLRVEEINILPSGTLLFKVVSSDKNLGSHNGNPTIFSQTLDIYPPGTSVQSYVVTDNLPFIIGLPEDKGFQGLCFEYLPDENFCYDDDLTLEIPHPLAWGQEPYFYMCNFDKLQYFDTRVI